MRPVNGLVGETWSAAERCLIATAAGLCVAYAIGALLIHPSLFPDPAYGLLVQKSMNTGAAWNHMVEPLSEDLARDRSSFYTIWSPGQYAVPAAFMKLGVSLGDALRAVNILASAIGLLGWFLLFRVLGFERLVALAACVFIAASRTFSFSFLAYIGSDLLAFAAFPYFAIALYAIRGTAWLVLAGPLFVLAGFFLKNSMAIYVISWLVAVAGVSWLLPARLSRRRSAWFAATLASAAFAMLALDLAYVSRGWTPVTYEPAWTSNVAAYLLPSSMPLLAGTAMDDVLSRLFSVPGRPAFDYKDSVLFLGPILLASAAFAVAELRERERQDVRVMILAFVGGVVLAFTYLLVTGSGASLYLSRHYIVPAYALMPLLIGRVLRFEKPVVRYGLLLCFLVPAVYGTLSFTANWKRHFDRRASHSDEVRLTHLTLTPRLVAYLRALDRNLPSGNTLAAVPIPSLALEFSRTRVLSTSATSDGIPEIRRAPRRGTVDNLVVIAERQGQTPEEIDAWLASFESYDPARWALFEADGFLFYVPLGQAVDRSWLEQEFRKTG